MHFSNLNIKKFTPFLVLVVIVVVVVIVAWYEQQKTDSASALPGPPVKLLSLEKRPSEGTDFTLPDLSRNSIRLAELKGNVVLVNFFATWCAPCRDEMPTLEKVFRTYQNKGFLVLGVAGDSKGQEVVEPFVKKYGVTFPVVLDDENAVQRQYGVRGIPAVYLFDRQGKIATMYVGGANWDSAEAHALIEQLLKES
jgi:peroxiredoxin